MRHWILGAAIAAVIGTTCYAQENLAPFQFMSLNSSLTLPEARARGIVANGRYDRCIPAYLNGASVTECTDGPAILGKDGIAGESVFGANPISFDGQGFVYMRVRLENRSFEPLLSAMTTRYGKPCADEESVIQNGFGATFPQHETTWCFSDGKLTLYRHDPEALDRASIQFIHKRFIKERATTPPINF